MFPGEADLVDIPAFHVLEHTPHTRLVPNRLAVGRLFGATPVRTVEGRPRVCVAFRVGENVPVMPDTLTVRDALVQARQALGGRRRAGALMLVDRD